MEKKRNKGLVGIWLVVILTIISLSLGGYIVYDKVLDKEEVKENQTGEVKEKNDGLEKNMDEQVSLQEVDNILSSGILNLLSYKNNLSELTNQEKVYIAYLNLINGENMDVFYTSEVKKEFTSQELKDAYFIDEYDFEDEDIYDIRYEFDFLLYKYDENTKKYIKNEDTPPVGSPGGIYLINFNYDYYLKEDMYTLEQYGVYNYSPSIGPNAAEYYATYNDAKNKSSYLFKNPYEIGTDAGDSFSPIDEISRNIEKYKSKMTKLTYSFKKIDNKLKLVDYKSSANN